MASFVLMVLVSLYLTVLLVWQLVTGKLFGRWFTVKAERSKEPIVYWSWILLLVIATGLVWYLTFNPNVVDEPQE